MTRCLPLQLALCMLVSSTSVAAQPAAATITLISPSDYQVFQRRTRDAGQVIVEGDVNLPAKFAAAKPDRLQARVTGDSLSGEWQALPFDARVARFRGELSAPVGGWYKLEVRLSFGERAKRSGTDARVSGIPGTPSNSAASNIVPCSTEFAMFGPPETEMFG
jgi:hypothetical protein